MLSIRIDYDVGRKLKAICALRGRTVREVMTGFAQLYVDTAEELPPESAAGSVKLAAMAQTVANIEQRAHTAAAVATPRRSARKAAKR